MFDLYGEEVDYSGRQSAGRHWAHWAINLHFEKYLGIEFSRRCCATLKRSHTAKDGMCLPPTRVKYQPDLAETVHAHTSTPEGNRVASGFPLLPAYQAEDRPRVRLGVVTPRCGSPAQMT